jgi:ABC-type oligopeptide transport system ATPase subunit
MYKGKIVEEKSTSELLRNPEHSYTKKLLEAADLYSDFNNSSRTTAL